MEKLPVKQLKRFLVAGDESKDQAETIITGMSQSKHSLQQSLMYCSEGQCAHVVVSVIDVRASVA